MVGPVLSLTLSVFEGVFEEELNEFHEEVGEFLSRKREGVGGPLPWDDGKAKQDSNDENKYMPIVK